MFSFENIKGKIQEFNITIGEQWSKQEVKSSELNTIFSLIDDGDGILSEQEYNIFDRLLKMADGSDGSVSNKISEIPELKSLIEKIKNKEIDLNDLISNPEEKYDEEKYSIENLKRRYPESKYEFEFPMSTQLCIVDKNTGKRVMEICYTNENEVNGVYTITECDKNGNEFFRVYNSQKELESYIGKDGKRHEVLPEKLYGEITKKKFGIIHTTGKNLDKYLNKLNKNNIEEMLAKYESISGNSLISDIFTERGLNSELRAKYVKQIIDTWLDARETKYVKKIDNFRDAFYKLIEKEKDGFSPMSTKKIEFLMKQIEDKQKVECVFIRSEEYETARIANGTINNDFSQGTEGDCWLISAIKSITTNPIAKQILEDQISVDKNGNVTIDLKFVGKKYTFTKDEIEKRNDLSEGDMDVRAIEMAVEKYFEEESLTFDIRSFFVEENALYGNSLNRAFEILLGKSGGIINRTTYKFVTDGLIESIKQGECLALVSAASLINDESDFTVKDEKGSNYKLYCNHAYTVKSADDEFVYIINPWDTSTTLMVPKEQFKSFFDSAGTYDISEINKSYFGENAIIRKDGKVLIHSKAKETVASSKEGGATIYVSKEELLAIKQDAEQKYGKNYNISVNNRGDVLLSPKKTGKA